MNSHPMPHNGAMPRARFAILCSNALMGLGLKALLERILPTVEVLLFTSVEELLDEERHEHIFHYFIESRLVEEHRERLHDKLHRTIRLTEGEAVEGHTLNIAQDEAGIVREIMRIRHSGHPAARGGVPKPKPEHQLTKREVEVLQLLTQGLINKEIADRMGVSLTTVISHRRNLSRKLGIRTVSALTIYAMMHGYTEIQHRPLTAH